VRGSLLTATCLLISLFPLPAHASSDLEVTVSGARFDTVLGDSETLEVEITNTGNDASGPLVGHLLVIDPNSDVSADAEDWTDELTRPLGSLAPGESTTIPWEVQPISTGEFFVMVAVAPVDSTADPAVSATTVFRISGAEASLEASVISVALAAPLVLLAAAWGVRRSERRRLAALAVPPD
jgi:hypothetical protein